MEDQPSRRSALGALASMAALAVPATSALTPMSAADVPLFDLLNRWRAAQDRSVVANDRFWEAEKAAHIDPPDALVKTENDKRMFYSDKTIVGQPFDDASLNFLTTALGVIALSEMDNAYIRQVADRITEVQRAHREYRPRIEAARLKVGYYALEDEQKAAHEAENTLRREVGNYRPKTIHGLLAKTMAIADDWGRQSLEEETVLEEGKAVSLDVVALTVLRDCAAIMGTGKLV